jgi:hypothetical protein
MDFRRLSLEAFPRPVKKLMKKFVPVKLIKWRKSRIQNALVNRSNTEIFSSTYINYRWGRGPGGFKLYSGDGSHKPEIIEGYISKVSQFLESLNGEVTVVDIGCGDFNIGNQLCKHADTYIACDVVPAVIQSNKVKYLQENVKFEILDAVTGQIPSGNVVILRQVLQHLSNKDIGLILEKIRYNYQYLVFTDHQPLTLNWNPNVDKETGPNVRSEFSSGLDLTKAPFDLPIKEAQLMDSVKTDDGNIRTFLYELSNL